MCSMDTVARPMALSSGGYGTGGGGVRVWVDGTYKLIRTPSALEDTDGVTLVMESTGHTLRGKY